MDKNQEKACDCIELMCANMRSIDKKGKKCQALCSRTLLCIFICLYFWCFLLDGDVNVIFVLTIEFEHIPTETITDRYQDTEPHFVRNVISLSSS